MCLDETCSEALVCKHLSDVSCSELTETRSHFLTIAFLLGFEYAITSATQKQRGEDWN
jgi:hypothetical protein